MARKSKPLESFKSASSLVGHLAKEEVVEQRRVASNKAIHARGKLYELSTKQQPTSIEVPMKTLKVFSNFARSRTIVLGSKSELVLQFDEHGTASCPEHLLPILEDVMRAKPGRFTLVQKKEETPGEVANPEILKVFRAAVQRVLANNADDDDSTDEDELDDDADFDVDLNEDLEA